MTEGIRNNYLVEADDWAIAPRLNIQYGLNETLKLKLGAGIFQQYISQLNEFAQNDLGINSKVWILSENETDTYLEAQKLSGGLVFQKKSWLIDFEVYAHQTIGLNTLTPNFNFDVEQLGYSTGTAFSKGMDLFIKKRFRNYAIWLSYALGKNDYDFPETEEDRFPATNDQRHHLNIINNVQLGKWNLSLSHQFRSGLPYTAPAGISSFYDEEDEATYYEIEFGAVNQQRLTPYHRTDIGISYKHNTTRLNYELAFSIINVFNRTNLFTRDYYLTDLDGSDASPEIFYVDKVLLKRTPQFLMRLYF